MAVIKEPANNSADIMKLLLALAILVLGVVGYYYYAAQPDLYRVLGMVGAAIVAAVIFFTTTSGRSLKGFLKNARTEVKKVVWPTRQEAIQTTVAVLVGVMIMGVFLWMLDMFLGWAVRFVITGG